MHDISLKTSVLVMSMLCMSHGLSYALPFRITPLANTPFPSIMTQGSTVYAHYTVENSTQSLRKNNYVKYLPPNVSLLPQGCLSNFDLSPYLMAGDHCTLSLAITGAVVATNSDPHQHLFVCFPGGITCSGTVDSLNVDVLSGAGTQGMNSVAALNHIIYFGGTNTSYYGTLWSYEDGQFPIVYQGGLQSPVETIVSTPNQTLYFGGQINQNEHQYSAWVSMYTPSTGTTLDTGFTTAFNATTLNRLAYANNTLYAAGIDSTGVQGQVWNYDGQTWTSLNINDAALTNATSVIYSSVKNVLYASFLNNGLNTTSLQPYAQVQLYNNQTWTDTGLPSSDEPAYLENIQALAVDSLGNLYVGGVDNQHLSAVWVYNGTTWSALPSPMPLYPGQINTLGFNAQGVLYAAGYYLNDTQSIGSIWSLQSNPTVWLNLALQGATNIISLTIDTDNTLYAGGLATTHTTPISGIWSMNTSQ